MKKVIKGRINPETSVDDLLMWKGIGGMKLGPPRYLRLFHLLIRDRAEESFSVPVTMTIEMGE